MTTPLDGVDLLMVDLDGVVYLGPDAVPHAVESLSSAGVPVTYLTNNASRTDVQVAEHLRRLGLEVQPSDVVTSPQAAMRLLAAHVSPGDAVLVVGGDGLTSEVEAAGWRVVRTAAEEPLAVVQGFAPHVGWTDLAEASFAVATGIPWIATNTDWTVPVAGGIAPGNGTLVAAVHTAVGRMPEVAGKPETPLFETARDRAGASSPLMIGDRLDTDILGANRAGMPSAHVLTGVDRAASLVVAPVEQRPTYVLGDLRELREPYPQARETFERSTGATYVEVGRAAVRRLAGELSLVRAGEGADTVRATCAAAWRAEVGPHALRVAPELLS